MLTYLGAWPSLGVVSTAKLVVTELQGKVPERHLLGLVHSLMLPVLLDKVLSALHVVFIAHESLKEGLIRVQLVV